MLHLDSANEFPQDTSTVHLNHARLGAWARCTQQAMADYSQQMQAPSASFMQQIFTEERRLCARLAAFIHAEGMENIALLKNTSEGLSLFAAGLSWQTQDEIVFAAQEFPSNQIVWTQTPAKCQMVDLYADETISPEQILINACSENTRLLAVSAVQYANGLRLDLQHLGEFCQRNGILFCVDAAQALGAMPIDVEKMHIDCLVACTHKWLLAAEGMGIFYLRTTLIPQVKMQQFGWYQLEKFPENPADIQAANWQFWQDARRFQAGSPNTLGIMLLSASLGLLDSLGQEKITQAILERIAFLREALSSLGATIHSPRLIQQQSGILSISFSHKKSDQLCQQLNQHGILCSTRHNKIRFAPHFYVSEEQLHHAVHTLQTQL